MQILKAILTGFDILVMLVFIFLVMLQTTRSEGIFSGGGGGGSYVKSKPGFEDGISRITLYLAIAFFVITAIVTYMP